MVQGEFKGYIDTTISMATETEEWDVIEASEVLTELSDKVQSRDIQETFSVKSVETFKKIIKFIQKCLNMTHETVLDTKNKTTVIKFN